MSFVVSAFGLTGMTATLAAGAAYGGMTTVGMNLIQGRGAFDNIGQGILLGGVTAGLTSGIGSALGGATPEAITAAETATKGIGVAGDVAGKAASNAAQVNTQIAIDEAVKKAGMADAAGDFFPDYYVGDKTYRDSFNLNPPAGITDSRISYSARQPDFVDNPFSQQNIGYMQGQGVTGSEIAQSAKEAAIEAAVVPPSAMQPRGMQTDIANYMVQNPTKISGLATPLISSAITEAKFNPPPKTPTQYAHRGDSVTPGFTQSRINPVTGMYEPAFYGPLSYYTNPYQTAFGARGGEVGYARGGIAALYPLTGNPVHVHASPGGLGNPGEAPLNELDIHKKDTPSELEVLFSKMSQGTLDEYSKYARDPATLAAAWKELNKRANTSRAAQGGLMGLNTYAAGGTQGGLMGLNTYAAGGTLLRGPGDGMSDSIPAVIQGQRPQRAALADGEFVFPADVVSHLGNGSTEAGSRRLYSMMDKIRQARTGNKRQGRQINPNKFMLA